MGDKDEGAESQPASQPGQGTTKSVKISNESSQKKNCSTKLREPQLVTKFGRKATLRFQTVARRLPKYHFDLAIKQKIATELKSMNCWSDDDDFESSKLFKSRSGDESDDSDSDGSYGFEEKVPKHSAASDKRGSQISITTTSKSMKNVGFNGSSASIKENILTFSVKANKSSKSGKHAYLEQQKEKQRIETRERLVKKAIKLILQIRKAEEDALKRRQMEGKLTPEQKLAIQKTAALRVGRIVARGLSLAVET